MAVCNGNRGCVYICEVSKGFTSYRIGDQNGLYYLTLTTVEWIDVFTRKDSKDILIDSFQYCQKNKGLQIYSWCMMSNHIHLIARAKEGYRLSDILRDFKKHTSKEITKAIEVNAKESRRTWLLELKNIIASYPKQLKP